MATHNMIEKMEIRFASIHFMNKKQKLMNQNKANLQF